MERSDVVDGEILKRLVLKEGKFHDLLYGKWAAWGGKRPPSHARQKLLGKISKNILKTTPSEVFLDVSTTSSRHIGVFAASEMGEKTVIGPVMGKHADSPTNGDTESTWELLDDRGRVAGYLETLDAEKGTWMGLIQCARFAEEENMEMLQDQSQIYYKATKHIHIGEELLVWYGNQFQQCFGIPDFSVGASEQINTANDELETSESTMTDDRRTKRVSCVLCRKGFNSRSNLRSHMRTHTQQRPFACNVCGRRFSQSSTLRNHVRLHTGEKPYKCRTCHSAYSQLAGLRAHQKSYQHRPKNFRTAQSLNQCQTINNLKHYTCFM